MNRVEVEGIKVNSSEKISFWQRMRGNPSRNNRDEDGLTITQRAFVEYFMESGVATDAYKKCAKEFCFDTHEGQEDQERFIHLRSYQFMTNPRIKEAIKKRRQHFQDKMEISEERVLREYACIAFAKLTDFYTITNKDVIIKNPEQLTPEQQAAIADISIFENVVKGTRRVAKIKLHDKGDALKSLSKHLGLFEKDNKQKSMVNVQLEEVLSALPASIADAVRKKIIEKSGLTDIERPKFLN